MTATSRLRMLPAMLHEPRLKMAARLTLAILMTLMGVGHFLEPAEFAAMVPAWLPAPHALVFVSGLAEVAGGVGLVMAPVARAAAYGLILLYIAVFPANINMAVHHISPLGTHVSPALLWARLPFQFLFIAWAWWLSRPSPASPSKAPAP
ncbi:MAG TPA: DoxX family membrane protein [Polyangia bacterium]|nr:DoxX family membrane protein [Polyangia bacterium]